MKQQLTARSLVELNRIAEHLLPLIKERKKVAFVGEIGAGKTTFIQVLCKLLGVEDTVSSPTFAIINEYASPTLPVYHIDLYRLKEEDELFSIGFVELLEQENYCMIEWPDLASAYLPPSTLWVKITATEENERKFDIFYE